MSVTTACLGHPRVGAARELKRALEAFWANRLPASELQAIAAELRRRHWSAMKERGIDHVPSNDFSLYDHMLDMAVLVGAVPARFQAVDDPLKRYFAMARGLQDASSGVDVAALEMTKWFDTNYHYIVPELELEQAFKLHPEKLLAELEEARRLGIETRPVIVGPVTFLTLSKLRPGSPGHASPVEQLGALLPIYEQLFGVLRRAGVHWIQLDEPVLGLDLDQRTRDAYRVAFRRLSQASERPRVMLTTYFAPLADNASLAVESGFDGIHVDLSRSPEQLETVLGIDASMTLSLGVIDGRNVWRADLERAHALVRRAIDAVGASRVVLAPSCSLLHVPIDVELETELDDELRGWLAFAWQKLDELRAIALEAESERGNGPAFEQAREALARRKASPRVRKPMVRARALAVRDEMLSRGSPYAARAEQQRARFGLPLFPTTTIGSFPQTSDVRGARAAHKAGRLSDAEYDAFLKQETRRAVERQEALDIDVLVHGEFERNDMVEYFGERLEGFAFTKNGWVQSYGSRCVKPPLLFGDVARLNPMTVEFWRYAQGVANRPVKGMLTGPVTILQWSFVRDDQPRAETCKQLALALRDEVADLEAAGAGMIQVDEPALREGLPLRRGERAGYLEWAVDAFRLSTAGVRDDTQIHTHMCYSEFGDILESIARMDADVISIETSRSKMELLDDFGRYRYPAEVGPGVYDIHSPRVPTAEEMLELLLRAARVLPPRRLWVNPDCGLKTRGWSEVEAALRNLVSAARLARAEVSAMPEAP